MQVVTTEQIQELFNEVGRLRAEGGQQRQLIQELQDHLAQREVVGDFSDEEERPKRGQGKRPKKLDEREFRECPIFAGDTANWDSWSHQLLVCCFEVPEAQKALEEVARKADPDNLDIDQRLIDEHASHLYRHLAKKTSGEANSLVRGVHSRKGKLCGFTAFAILAQRYNPKTPARLLQHLMGVVSPERVKDVRKLQSHVEAWETRAGKLAYEFGERLSDKLQTAVFVSMLPKDLQDIAFQACPEGDQTTYRVVRDKIMAIAQNRAHEMSQPVPMDIGYMGDDQGQPEPEEDGQQPVDIDAIRGYCHNCQGWGHAAAECPSEPNAAKNKPKGNGKSGGNTSNGKGNSKGKGKGKGFQGYCWTCGEKGHSQDRCRASGPKRVAEVTADAPEQAQQPSNIANISKPWPLCSVDVVTRAARWRPAGAKGGKIDVNNRFAPLADTSEYPPLQPSVRSSMHCSRSQVPSLRPKQASAKPARVQPSRSLSLRSTVRPHVSSCPQTLPCISYHGMQREPPAPERPRGPNNVRFIGPVEKQVCAVTSEVTVDSAAEESVCPKSWGDHFGLVPAKPGEHMTFINANGGRIAHHGSRKVIVNSTAGQQLSMNFQVTDVQKPLLAVSRLIEQGNVVQFGKRPGHSYIQNLETGEKLLLERRHNSWVIPGKLADSADF